MFPWALIEGIKLAVSINRITRFLNADELDPDVVARETENEENAVEIEKATFAW